MVILTSSTSFPGLKPFSTESNNVNVDNKESLMLDSRNHHKLTHLHLEQKAITEIGEMASCPRLLVLYLYDNKLSSIQNLDFCRNLTHLYLQNNRITRIQNLHPLKHLQKLFLSGNKISVLEGLEKNTELSELYLDYQRMKPGDFFVTDKRTMANLQNSLRVLNISGTTLSSLLEFQDLKKVTTFTAAKNDGIKEVDTLIELLTTMPDVEKLDLSGCPVAKTNHYREKVTVACPKIVELDGKSVSKNSRQFMLGMRESLSHTNFHRPSKEEVDDDDSDISGGFVVGRHLSRTGSTISSSSPRKSSSFLGRSTFVKPAYRSQPRLPPGAWVQAVRRVQSQNIKPIPVGFSDNQGFGGDGGYPFGSEDFRPK